MTEVQGWPHREQIAVRYAEVDAQRVVFNAHYLTWCDIACAGWLREAIGWTGVDDEVDWMLVAAEIAWQGSASFGDTVDIDCGIARWGRTSFAIAYRGTVEGRPVFTATITYVCVTPGTTDKVEVAPAIRDALGMAPVAS